MNTPADKPDLPALPICDGFGKHGDEIYLPDSVREYGRRCAEAARADERRKALLDAAWAARPMTSGRAAETAILRMIDRKEPTK
jgi:hypothetical protein